MNEIDLIKEVDKRVKFYGNRRHGNPENAIDDLTFIILSNQTEEYSYDENVITYLTSLPRRISRRLGLIPSTPKPTDRQSRDLEIKIPLGLRRTLHINMVSHGRQICTTYWPKCETCVLAEICPGAGKAYELWGEWRKPRGAWANYKSEQKNDKDA